MGFIFFISIGFVVPFNFPSDSDKKNQIHYDIKLQINSYSYSIEWLKSWNFSVFQSHEILNEKAYLIAVSQDGKHIIASGNYGYCSPGEWEGNAFLVKLNERGDYFWNKTLSPSSGQNFPEKLFFSSDNNYYFFLTGVHGMLCEQFDHCLYKYDKNGNLHYSIRNYSSDRAFTMALDSVENIYIVGQTYAEGKMFVSKYNRSGDFIWWQLYDTGAASLYDINTDSQGNFFVINAKSLMKLNSNGNLIWTINLSDSRKIRIDQNNKIYILTNSELIEFDGDGNKLLQIVTTSSLIELDENNNLYLLEANELVKLDSNGSREILLFDNHISAFCIDSEANIYTTGILDGDFIVKKYGIDSDHDNLTDWTETNIYFTNPNYYDSDGDDLSDGEEVNTYFTDPNNEDTDGDGFTDGEEITKGFDPNDKFSKPSSKPSIPYVSILLTLLVASLTVVIIIIMLRKRNITSS